MEITVDKALRLKNRLIDRITTITAQIQQFNCVIEPQKPEVDVLVLDATRSRLIQQLIDLKFELYNSNLPIQRLIFEASEIKTAIVAAKGLITTDGQISRGYGVENTYNTYKSSIKYNDVQNALKTYQKRLDDIQDALHKHNHTKTIAIDDNLYAELT